MAAAAGVNAVRLPVGYWALATAADEAAPFVPGAWAYIDAALDWGFQTGIGTFSLGLSLTFTLTLTLTLL